MLAGYTICYYGSIIMGAYCIGWVHNMLLWQYKDGSILCRQGKQYVAFHSGGIAVVDSLFAWYLYIVRQNRASFRRTWNLI